MTRPAPSRAGRSALAIAAGFLATAIASLGTDALLHATGVYPPWGAAMAEPLFVLATAYRLAFTILGGYVTARLAPSRPMRHAWILGGIGTALAVAGAAAAWSAGPELGPRWFAVALVVTALPCVWAGGKLAARREASPATA